jgi:hypothetical protein
MKGRSKKFGPRLTVSLTGDDYDALNALADKDEVSISWVVRRAIEEYLRRRRPGFDQAPRSPTRDDGKRASVPRPQDN